MYVAPQQCFKHQLGFIKRQQLCPACPSIERLTEAPLQREDLG